MQLRRITSIVSAMVLLGSVSLAAISIIHEEVESFGEATEFLEFIDIISGTIIPQQYDFNRVGEVFLEQADFSVSDVSFHSVPSNRFTPPRPVQDPLSLKEYRLSNLEEPACFYVKISCNGFVLELRDSSGANLGRVPLQTLPKPPSSISNFPYNPDFRVYEQGGVQLIPKLSSSRSNNRSVVRDETYFEGYVFDPPDYASYAVFKDGIELVVMERSDHAPIAGLAGIAEGQIFGGDDYIELSLSVWDEDGDDLVYDIFLTEELNNYGKFNTAITEEVISSDEIRIPNSLFNATGSATIGVSVSDGTRSVFVETPVFRLEDRPPRVRIISPAQNKKPRYSACPDSFRAPENCLLLAASGNDPEERSGLSNSSYSWASNVDGDLGTGRYPAIPVDQLTFGEHTITVTFTNDQGESVVDSVDIIIQEDDINQISDI